MGREIPPGLILLLGAALVPFLRGRIRQGVMLALPIVSFAAMLSLGPGEHLQCEAFGWTLTLARVDRWSVVFGVLFHLAAFLGVLFSLHVEDRAQQVAGLVYAGSAIGAVFAGDLLTLFLYWEVVGIAPVFLILGRGVPASTAAALRYLLVQVVSGLLLLSGIALVAAETGSIAFQRMALDAPGPWLLFLGIGVKCGWPLLHGWIPDAYPRASATGTVFLSAFTTKLAVYALARTFPGEGLLVPIGTVMAVFPVFYAAIENDLRRVLSYSMINQVGYMVVGVGIGTELSLNGTAAHAFCHVLYKGLLFMTMGAVLHRTGRIHATDLGGLRRAMPWTAGFCLVGAASIAALPLFSGFVCKAMIFSAAAAAGHPGVYFGLLFAAVGAFAFADLKVPLAAFFGRDVGLRPPEAPRHMLFAMAIAALLSIGLGVFPRALYDILPYPVEYVSYTVDHVVQQLQLMSAAALALLVLQLTHVYPLPLRAVNLDVDTLYRRAGTAFLALVSGPLSALFRRLDLLLHEGVPRVLSYAARNPAGAARLGLDRIRLAAIGLFGSPQGIASALERYEADRERYLRTAPAVAWPVGRAVLFGLLALAVFLLAELVG